MLLKKSVKETVSKKDYRKLFKAKETACSGNQKQEGAWQVQR